VIEWAEGLIRKRLSAKRIVEASKSGAEGYPGSEPLSDGTLMAVRAVIAYKEREARKTPKAKKAPTDSGKALRELYSQRKAGASGDLFNLQIEIMEAVRTLEAYELPDLDWSESTQDLIIRIFDYLSTLEKWHEIAMATTVAHMDDLGRQRKLRALKERAEDPSSTPNERANAARLADKLERQLGSARLTG
jgi:hypothetical protein